MTQDEARLVLEAHNALLAVDRLLGERMPRGTYSRERSSLGAAMTQLTNIWTVDVTANQRMELMREAADSDRPLPDPDALRQRLTDLGERK